MLQPAKGLLLGLLAVYLCHLWQQADASDAAFEAMKDWVIENGGMVKATIGYNSKGVRGLFATEHIPKGGYVATVTGASILNSGSISGNFFTPVLSVLREMKAPHSRFKPYFDYVPKMGQIHNLCTFPEEYLPLMSYYMAKHVKVVQDFMKAALNLEVQDQLEYTIPEVVGSVDVSYEELQYACAVASTRYVASHERGRLLLIPIYDLGNHDRLCPTLLTQYDTRNEISIVAGEDLDPGQEICNTYGLDLRADHAFLHYGFLPEEEDPPMLFTEDHHLFDPDTFGVTVDAELFYGTAEETEAEIRRLRNRLQGVEGRDKKGDDAYMKPKPPGEDALYDMIMELRQRRKRALRYEIRRLQQDLDVGAVSGGPLDKKDMGEDDNALDSEAYEGAADSRSVLTHDDTNAMAQHSEL